MPTKITTRWDVSIYTINTGGACGHSLTTSGRMSCQSYFTTHDLSRESSSWFSTASSPVLSPTNELPLRDDRHSTSGNLFIYCGGIITWSSKKQVLVEYIVHAAAQEVAWINKLLFDFSSLLSPSSWKITKGAYHSSRTQLAIQGLNILHEAQENGLIRLKYCPTEEMLANFLDQAAS